MLHTFKFNYNNKPYYFFWDVESGSLHSVDYLAYIYAKNHFNIAFEGSEGCDFANLQKPLLAEIESEMDELVLAGLINSPKTENISATKLKGEIKALCLHICHDCNMRCSYCFAKDGTYNTAKDYMTFEVGKQAIDFLIAKSNSRKNLEVDFFGGEPLLNLEVVKQIVAYAKNEVAKVDKNINFTLTTNGILLNAANSHYLNETMENVIISIDGRRDKHNYLRKTANNKDCFDLIVKNAVEFKKIRGDKKYYIRGTFTANNLDFSNDVLALNDMGFDQISVEPVVLDCGSPFAITESMLPQLINEYDVLAQSYIERRKGEKWFSFFHFMVDLNDGPCLKKRLTGCGAGSEYLAVTPTGEIYPCHQFAGNSKYLMGNVLTNTFNTVLQKHFASISLESKKACQNCFAKYFCGGGCCANAINFNNDITKPYEIGCKLLRKRFENALAISAIENEDVGEV